MTDDQDKPGFVGRMIRIMNYPGIWIPESGFRFIERDTVLVKIA